MIPEFDNRGELPPGIHHASWDQIVTRYAINTRRSELLDGLLQALRSLRTAGCGVAYLDGSFVSAKQHPGDFDACWESTGVDAAHLDDELLDFSDARAAQKARYGGELFPVEASAEPAGTTFLDYLQRDRHSGAPKGIIAITLRGLP